LSQGCEISGLGWDCEVFHIQQVLPMLLTPPSELAAQSPSHEPSPHAAASYVHRCSADRRKVDGFPPPGCAERRVQAERRGIRLTEFDFDERITIVAPARTNQRASQNR
jgi:hypothetical protein